MNWRYEQVIRADGPAGYWRLGERAGTSAIDLVAANTGTYAGTYTLGAPGGVNDGDGAFAISTAAYGKMTAAAIATGASVWSIEAWINPAALPNNNDSPAVINGTSAVGYGFAVNNGGGTAGSKLAILRAGIAWFDTGYTFPAANAWYHVVVTRDGTTAIGYVNAVAAPNTTIAAFNAPATSTLVGTYDVTARFNGTVDELAIYAHALSPAQILNHYRAGVRRDY